MLVLSSLNYPYTNREQSPKESKGLPWWLDTVLLMSCRHIVKQNYQIGLTNDITTFQM